MNVTFFKKYRKYLYFGMGLLGFTLKICSTHQTDQTEGSPKGITVMFPQFREQQLC